MNANYQCGRPATEWLINMLHNRKRYVIDSMETTSEPVGEIEYIETFDNTDSDNPVLITRVARLQFPAPTVGSAVLKLKQIE